MAGQGPNRPTIPFLEEPTEPSPEFEMNFNQGIEQMVRAPPADASQYPTQPFEKPQLPIGLKQSVEDKIKKAALQHPTPTGHKFVQDDSKEDKLIITKTTPGKGGVDWTDVQNMARTYNGNGYQFIRHIEGGSYGQVYEVKLTHSKWLTAKIGTRFAIKIMKIPQKIHPALRSARMAKQVIETCILINIASVRPVHKNLLNPYEIVTKNGMQQVYVIMKLREFGNLTRLAIAHWVNEKKPFLPREIRHLTFGIGDGIRYLKQHLGVAHCDLKPENILLFDNPKKIGQHDVYLPKLCDFSNSAKRLPEDKPHKCTANGMRCFLGFHAPETYDTATNKKYNAFAADVYSFGALIYWMWRRQTLTQSHSQFQANPYHNDNIKHVLNQQQLIRLGLANVSRRIDELIEIAKRLFPAMTDPRPFKALKDVLERAFQLDTKKRITIEQMLLHDYFH